jgi:RecA/RadA recombinase
MRAKPQQTMTLAFKHAIAAIILVPSFAALVAAGPLEDADVAVKRRDYATAVRLIRPLAEQGDATAQYNLGVFYDNGLGVPQDRVSAYMWFSPVEEPSTASKAEINPRRRWYKVPGCCL